MKPANLPRHGFDPVLAAGSGIIRETFFDFRFLSNSLPRWQFAVIVPKRVAKRAVDRNRMKRLLKEALRQAIGNCDTGYDAVCKVKRDFSDLTIREIYPIVQEMINKACSNHKDS